MMEPSDALSRGKSGGITARRLEPLTALACRLGAGGAAVIPTEAIKVEDHLADLCREPRCENYGLSSSCPPHVAGPAGFRRMLSDFRTAIVIKLEVPASILLSDERSEVMALLHEIAAEVEQAAVAMGYPRSKAFAGGSCKKIFCAEHPDCRVVGQGEACRNPHRARPSMSGFGIDVSKLMRAAGWDLVRADDAASAGSMAAVVALILIG